MLGVEIDALQKTFDVFLEQRYGALRKALAAPEGLSADMPLDALKAMASANPGSFPAQLALGMALKKTAPDQAIEAFERAAALVPHATGPDSPQAQIAEVALAKGDKARAIKALDTLTGFDHSDLASARKLATLLDPKQDAALLQTALRRAVAVDPFDSASHTTLGRMALSGGDAGRSGARCSRWRWRPVPSIAPARTPIWPKACSRPATRTRPGSRRWPRSRSPRPTPAPRTSC